MLKVASIKKHAWQCYVKWNVPHFALDKTFVVCLACIFCYFCSFAIRILNTHAFVEYNGAWTQKWQCHAYEWSAIWPFHHFQQNRCFVQSEVILFLFPFISSFYAKILSVSLCVLSFHCCYCCCYCSVQDKK